MWVDVCGHMQVRFITTNPVGLTIVCNLICTQAGSARNMKCLKNNNVFDDNDEYLSERKSCFSLET
jgi:hypothetical protein